MAVAGRTPAGFRLPDYTTFLEYLQLKIEREQYPIDEPVDDSECNGNTFLMEAVHRADIEAVKYLVAAGADLDIVTSTTALASYNSSMDSSKIIPILRYLLDNGALFIQDIEDEYTGLMPDERAKAQLKKYIQNVTTTKQTLDEKTIRNMAAIYTFLTNEAKSRVFDASISVVGQNKTPMILKYDKSIDIRKLKQLIEILYLKDTVRFDLLMPGAQIGKTKKEINANKTLNVNRTMADYVGSRYNTAPVKLVVAPKIRSGFGGRRKTLKRR